MNLLQITLKSLRQRLLPSALTALSVALGVALVTTVLILNLVVGRIFSQDGTGYHLLVGPKGSDSDLVLSNVYRISTPTQNLPWRYYEELKRDKRVAKAIPLAVSDVTEEGQFPIVATMPQYFSLDCKAGTPFEVSGDFLQATWDAVIGAHVARKNNWGIGTEFKLVHSGTADHVHNELFTVKGILEPTGTANDRSVFVHLDGFFSINGHGNLEDGLKREADFFGESDAELRQRYAPDLKEAEAHAHHDHGGEHHHHHHHSTSDLIKGVSAILVLCKGEGVDASSFTLDLQGEINKAYRARAVNPVQVMRTIMDNLVGNIRIAFLCMTALIIAVSGVGIFVSIYNSMSDRKRDIAVMRALGARRQTVFLVILLESIMLCLGGGILGVLLGHGLTIAASPMIARKGLLIDPFTFDPQELVMIPIMLTLASLVGFLPALTAYRTDVAETLSH